LWRRKSQEGLYEFEQGVRFCFTLPSPKSKVPSPVLHTYQQAFLDTALAHGVLRFGDFTL
jgi:hypothetical protein